MIARLADEIQDRVAIVLAAAILALFAAGAAAARPTGADRLPAAGPGYVPTDADERGLWMRIERYERETQTSDFLVRDPVLNAFVQRVMCRVVGEIPCKGLRLYVLRDASFNASMAANGMVTVNTGMLLRLRNEAQLAAVLGHEYSHFAERHTLREARDERVKAGRLALLSVLPAVDRISASVIRLAQVATQGSIYSFSRDMEREADEGSVPLMAAAGYDPAIAPTVWQRLLDEEDAARTARRRKIAWRQNRFFATHPAKPDRIAALTKLLRAFGGRRFAGDGAETYRAAVAPWWPQLIDDQIKLNDFGGTDWLINELATDGWTPALLYARGELYRTRGRAEDLRQAASFYRRALAGDAPAEAWRGLGLVSLRGGDAADGRKALRTYLARKPDAADRAMIAMLAEEPGEKTQ